MGSDRIHYWLGIAAREAREDTALIRSQIAGLVPCDTTVIRGFETGRSVPQQLDRILDIYAQECGLADYREIWQRAIKLSFERSETEEFEAPIRQAADSPDDEAPPPSERKRRPK